MATKREENVLDQMYRYQTRLQGVANDLAVRLAKLAMETDPDVAKLIVSELRKKPEKTIKDELKRMQKLLAKVEIVRKKTYDAAKDLLLSTSADVAKIATDETAREFNLALGAAAKAEREKRFCKTLTPAQQKAIIDGQGISGATIGDWFHRWKRSDLENISSAVQEASVEEMTVADITRKIRGTAANGYTDGILATTQVAAARLARTIINGVSNNTRIETIKENSDVIDGVKFIGTLDGKTCPYCGSLDGQIWRGEEMGQARRPPIHPNCRCTLVPYVELKDSDGNVIEVDAERPAANADFDKLAQEAYDDQARQKGWSRRWDDLAPSTRLKYYYQAQKDFEAETGKPAYDQVPASVSFADYFKGQPDEFKRSWLGAKRFEQYQNGTLTQEKLFAPDLGYMKTTRALFQVVRGDDGVSAEKLAELARDAKETGEELQARADLFRAYLARDSHRNGQYEDLRLDGKSLAEALRETNFRESFKRYELDERLRERETSEMLEGFEKQDKKNKAAGFAKKTFDIDVKYRRIPLVTLNDLNQELIRARNMFGTIGIIERIEPSDDVLARGSFASYNWKRKVIEVRPERGRFAAKQYIDNARPVWFSTDSPLHGYRHEIGHSLLCYCEECLVWRDRSEMINTLKELHARYFILSRDGIAQLSEYAGNDYREMVAEAIAQLMNNTASPLSKEILKTLKGKTYDNESSI